MTMREQWIEYDDNGNKSRVWDNEGMERKYKNRRIIYYKKDGIEMYVDRDENGRALCTRFSNGNVINHDYNKPESVEEYDELGRVVHIKTP